MRDCVECKNDDEEETNLTTGTRAQEREMLDKRYSMYTA